MEKFTRIGGAIDSVINTAYYTILGLIHSRNGNGDETWSVPPEQRERWEKDTDEGNMFVLPMTVVRDTIREHKHNTPLIELLVANAFFEAMLDTPARRARSVMQWVDKKN